MKFRLRLVVLSATLLVGTLLGYTLRSAKADGVPNTLTYSGTLEDATGKPISGTKQIGVSVWDSATTGTGTKVCEAPVAGVPVTNGRFDVSLPDSICGPAIRANPNLWIEVGVEGESLGRAKLGAVPYALEAARASGASGALSADVLARLAGANAGMPVDLSTMGNIKINPTTQQMTWQAGAAVVDLDGNGEAIIAMPYEFPTGILSLQVSLGDTNVLGPLAHAAQDRKTFKVKVGMGAGTKSDSTTSRSAGDDRAVGKGRGMRPVA